MVTTFNYYFSHGELSTSRKQVVITSTQGKKGMLDQQTSIDKYRLVTIWAKHV